MQIHRRLLFSDKTRFLSLFLIGLFGGLIYGWLFAPDYIEKVGFLSDAFLLAYLKQDIEKNQLFSYLLKGRMISLVFIWLLGSSVLGNVLIFGALIWSGFSVGLYVMAGFFKRGISGLGFCVAAVFPQILFYLPAYGLVFMAAYKIIGRRDVRKEGVIKYCIVLFASFLLLFLGILMESYVNPAILKKILKIF